MEIGGGGCGGVAGVIEACESKVSAVFAGKVLDTLLLAETRLTSQAWTEIVPGPLDA